MRIKTIEFENFRNFRDHGYINCSTDGKITVIYGKNGDGKTTLHQLFQWVFYNRVSFNKTATDHLYNLAFEKEQDYRSVFSVMGRIDFEHDGKQYSVMRKYTYRKNLSDSEKIGEEFSLQKMDDDYNWLPVDRPKEAIERLLPSGLAEYFFFDGESMIADLRVKGRDSASKLRKALYSMFDLDLIESAIAHIGRIDLRTTVLGKLYISQGSSTSDSQIRQLTTNINNAQARIEKMNDELATMKEEQTKCNEIIREKSEQIGSSKSKEEYETRRAELKTERERYLQNSKNELTRFGDEVLDMFPPLLISKAVESAKDKLNLKISNSTLPSGLNNRLIAYLLKSSTTRCICGREMCDSERDHIREFLNLLPPKSYASLYNDFTRRAEQARENYDKDKIDFIIRNVIDNLGYAEECDKHIKELDDEEKTSPDIEDLIVERQNAEDKATELTGDIANKTSEINKFTMYLNQEMKKYNAAREALDTYNAVEQKITIMEKVKEYFSNKLDTASHEYSQKLQENIQFLLDKMLTSKRTVTVSKEFAVRVTDSYNDESKSEGQFAVVSFAYIGGILKMLKDDPSFHTKEYPLVLDGPFSKLDPDQRQNVVNTLPQFAPQVIVFSKDDLHSVIENDSIGRVWTIVSNEEKNIAHIEEGKLWK